MSKFKKIMGAAVLGAAAAGVALYYKKSQEDKLSEDFDKDEENYFAVFDDDELFGEPEDAEGVKETGEADEQPAEEEIFVDEDIFEDEDDAVFEEIEEETAAGRVPLTETEDETGNEYL